MTFGTLVRFRLRALARRIGLGRPGGAVALAAWLVAGAGVLAGLGFLGAHLAEVDAGLERAVRDRIFWLTTLGTLVWSYTTFEILFRAPDARFIGPLPIRGATRFDDLFVRAFVIHLGLLVPTAGYALGALGDGHPEAAAFAALFGGSLYLFGLPVSLFFHLWAGRSMLGGPSELKRILAGAVVADDAALLIYAPALGLLVTLVAGIVLELIYRDVAFRGLESMLAPALAAVLALAFVAYRTARGIADAHLHRILPRFAEADTPPPFHDDGVKAKTPGEGLAPRLPTAARAFFLRDLRQLRRRHRLDRILLVVFLAALLKVHLGTKLAEPLLTNLAALTLANGLFLLAAFRLRGRELGAPALDRTLPLQPRPAATGRLLAIGIYPFWTAILAALATLTGGSPLAALATLGAGLGLVALVVLSSWALAERVADERIALAATAYRAAMLALTALFASLPT